MKEKTAMQQLINMLKESIAETKRQYEGDEKSIRDLESNINTIINGAELLLKFERKQIEDAVNYTIALYDTPYQYKGSEYYKLTFDNNDTSTEPNDTDL